VSERFYKLLHERHAIQRYLSRRLLFPLFQRLGFHISAEHFYELTPDTRLISSTYSDSPRELDGVEWRFQEAETLAVRLIKAYGSDYIAHAARYGFTEQNPYFRGLDALILYAVLREMKPGSIVEVGQGSSTRIILAALAQNFEESGTTSHFVSVDPYPRLAEISSKVEGVRVELIRDEIQRVDPIRLLDGCEFLFVDSSHVYKFGSDVEFEFTQLYSSLQANAILHIHDIFSPYQYPRDWMVQKKRFWNEQYVLEHFLMFNWAFEPYLPVYLLSRRSEQVLTSARSLQLHDSFKFEGYSFYIRRRPAIVLPPPGAAS
jgi:hypothetical protein